MGLKNDMCEGALDYLRYMYAVFYGLPFTKARPSLRASPSLDCFGYSRAYRDSATLNLDPKVADFKVPKSCKRPNNAQTLF